MSEREAPSGFALPADPLALLEDAPCGLLQTDEEGLILWANRTFCQWLGVEAGELAKRRLQDLLTMGGRIFHQTHFSPLLQIQGSVSEVKLEVLHRDGHAFPVIVNAVLHERHGRRVQDVAVYIARDRDRYEKELVLSRRKLEATLAEAQRLREDAKERAHVAEQMVGIVSHDLRNPLSVIHMSMALLDRIGATPQQRTILSRVARSTERANRLISELLDFTQARLGGGIKVNPRPLDLRPFVHDAVDELKHAFAGRGLEHEHEGAETTMCMGDPDRLAQVVGNLVGNAMAYGDAARPVTVKSRARDGHCEIAVHNFGPAIPAEKQVTIFSPLERGDMADASGRSIGLGLYIVSEIAQAHRGTVTVLSHPETGTEFTVTIPCATA
ncbi:MAG TPA: PAS domain-containing sensor histidine kinase [Ramlibacter sp.]|nr:PAS domain-containing sensor histidine kinase [Ramlibacter sp.]